MRAPTDHISLSSDELHVWWAWLDDGRWPDAGRLPGAEWDRAARMHRPDVRRRWVGSRWALRSVLAHYLEQAPEAIELCTGTHGKPMLGAGGTPRFNLSHSDDWALIAVTREREVGVDIEAIRMRHNLCQISRRALPPSEAALVESASPQSRLAVFHSAWARMEAIAKCFGTGLIHPPPKLAVSVRHIDAGPNFAAAVAVAGHSVPTLHHFAIEPRIAN